MKVPSLILLVLLAPLAGCFHYTAVDTQPNEKVTVIQTHPDGSHTVRIYKDPQQMRQRELTTQATQPATQQSHP